MLSSPSIDRDRRSGISGMTPSSASSPPSKDANRLQKLGVPNRAKPQSRTKPEKDRESGLGRGLGELLPKTVYLFIYLFHQIIKTSCYLNISQHIESSTPQKPQYSSWYQTFCSRLMVPRSPCSAFSTYRLHLIQWITLSS